MTVPSIPKPIPTRILLGSVKHVSLHSRVKALQSDKIQELRQVLLVAGFSTLNQQARCLGLSRSTAWAVLKGTYKGSGLSATLIKRMLASPELPDPAKKVILEYVENKTAGLYGHKTHRIGLFRAQLSI